MKLIKFLLTAIIVVSAIAAIPSSAQEADSNSVKTVEQLYPNLASGVLTYAKVASLPENILLRAEGIEMNSRDINEAISKQPEQVQQELKDNAFFVLEQEATGKLLKVLARKHLSEQGKDTSSMTDQQTFQAYLEDLTKEITVANKDVETFYKENESIFCGTPLDSVRKQIQSYVLQDKKQRFVDEYIKTVGQRIDIQVSDSWTKNQNQLAKDNPLDKARSNGKPTLAVFSAKSCCGPDKMLPVIDSIKARYNDKVNIVYVEPQQEQILSARYGIRSIPTQIFYDSKGKETFRHSGFFSDADIVTKLSEMGIK
jgi:thioredoxin 1